jgi:hypothetical protein
MAAIVAIHQGGTYDTASDHQQIANVVDIMVMYEQYIPNGHGSPTYPTLPAWMSNFANSKFSALVNGVSAANLHDVMDFFLGAGCGFIYVTDVDGGVEEDTTYWNNELAWLNA